MTTPADRDAAPRRRRFGGGWAVVLLGTVAAAVMLPQFAFFVPVVFAAWLLARFGFAPRFLRPRHPAVRLVPGPDAALTCVSFTVEAEREHGEVLDTLRRAATAHAGEPRDDMSWGAGAPRQERDLAPLQRECAEIPRLREALLGGARVVLVTTREEPGRSVRVEGRLAGERAPVERIAQEAASALRSAGVEVVTTGWLRHAERLAAERG